MKRLLLFFLALISIEAGAADAKTYELLLNLHGEQMRLKLPPGSVVTPEAEIFWDTRKHGAIPIDAPIGFAERYEVSPGVFGLRANDKLKKEFDDHAAAAQKQKEADDLERQDFLGAKDRILKNSGTAQDATQAVKYMLKTGAMF